LGLDIGLKVSSFFYSHHENQDYNVSRFALISLYSVSFILALFGTINYTINDNYNLGRMEFILSFLSLMVVVHYKIYKEMNFLLFMTTLLLFSIAIIFYLYSAKVLFSSIWLLFFPSVVFLLNSIKLGVIYSLIYICIISTIAYDGIGQYSTFTGFLNLFIGLIFFTILAYIFEKNRLKSFKEIKSINTKLEKSLNENRVLLEENKQFIVDSIHQIKTPLTNIMMNSEMIEHSQKDNKYLDFTQQINASICMLTNSYDDLSYIISYDSINYDIANISLSKILKERIKFFQIISKVNFKPIISNIVDEIYLDINIVELERLIDNNISNAIKYATQHKDIKIWHC